MSDETRDTAAVTAAESPKRVCSRIAVAEDGSAGGDAKTRGGQKSGRARTHGPGPVRVLTQIPD